MRITGWVRAITEFKVMHNHRSTRNPTTQSRARRVGLRREGASNPTHVPLLGAVLQFRAPSGQPSTSPPTAFRPDGQLPDTGDAFTLASSHIRCPACKWVPEKTSRWFCVNMGPPENFNAGCSHAWNTFDTGGKCPGCTHQWQHTTCLTCSVTTPHNDWYVNGAQPGGP